MTQHAGLPVAGYQPQSDDKVQTVNRRRKKYGKSGHAGVYERGPMWHTVRDEKRLARLVAVCLNDGLLTAGQVSKIIEADRLRVREVRDEGMMCLSYRPLLGEWGAATMNRMFG